MSQTRKMNTIKNKKIKLNLKVEKVDQNQSHITNFFHSLPLQHPTVLETNEISSLYSILSKNQCLTPMEGMYQTPILSQTNKNLIQNSLGFG